MLGLHELAGSNSTCLQRGTTAVQQCQPKNPPNNKCYLIADPPACCLMLSLHKHLHPDGWPCSFDDCGMHILCSTEGGKQPC